MKLVDLKSMCIPIIGLLLIFLGYAQFTSVQINSVNEYTSMQRELIEYHNATAKNSYVRFVQAEQIYFENLLREYQVLDLEGDTAHGRMQAKGLMIKRWAEYMDALNGVVERAERINGKMRELP